MQATEASAAFDSRRSCAHGAVLCRRRCTWQPAMTHRQNAVSFGLAEKQLQAMLRNTRDQGLRCQRSSCWTCTD